MAKESVNIFRKIIRWVRLFLISRAMKRVDRHRRVISYACARQIGLLCDLGDRNEVAFLNRFIKKLEADGKKITPIGYYSKKQVADVNALPEGLQWFRRKDFSLFLRPQRTELQNFAKQPFDILIDLTSARALPMKYIAAVSTASFKAGAHNQDYINIFDLVLQVKEDYPVSEFAEQVIHYLKIIKTPGEK